MPEEGINSTNQFSTEETSSCWESIQYTRDNYRISNDRKLTLRHSFMLQQLIRYMRWAHLESMYWTWESILRLDWNRTPSNLLQFSCYILSITDGRWKLRALARLKRISLVLFKLGVKPLMADQALASLNSISIPYWRTRDNLSKMSVQGLYRPLWLFTCPTKVIFSSLSVSAW